MHLRKRVAALTAAALAATTIGINLLPSPAEAASPPPVIINNDTPQSGNASWLETQNLTDESNNRIVQATFLVQHEPGRTITGVKFDANWNGTDDTAGNALIPLGSGTHFVSATKVAGTQSSVVTARINVGNGPNFSGRAFNAPFRMRVVDSTNEQSAPVAATIRFVEEGQATGSADFPSLRSITPPVGGDAAPGAAVSFQMQCDDPDINFLSSDDECDRARLRWRSLDTGDTIALADFGGIGDNQLETVNTTAPTTSGHWVIEAWFGNENGSFPTDGQGTGSSWWRLGKVVVNAGGAINGTITFAGGSVVASSPPSVNPGAAVTADAAVAQSGGGIQAIEWNLDHNSGANASFEELFYGVPTLSGGNVNTPPVTSVAGATSRPVVTATPGLKTVQMRLTDFGSLDMADTNRKQATITSGILRVNALPTANTFSVNGVEDTPLGITLTGGDTDSQPNPLSYTLLSNVAAAAGSVSCVGSSCTYTPALNYNGTASFTYRVSDCGATVGACANSAAGTVTINVAAVNDDPTIAPKTLTTPEDTQGSVQLTGTDVEPGTLTYSVNPGGQATNGTAVCPASGLCTYTPNLNFFGSDSFVVRGTDSEGGFGTATVTVTVSPVNDAPTANDQSVTVTEDAVNFPIGLTGADVDDVVLGFVAPVDDVDNGTLTCLGASCTYSPNENYNGPDSFTFKVNDGEADSNTATVTIDVTAVNDDPVAVDVLDAEADEDVPEPIAANGTDVDTGDVVTVDSATDPANGSTAVTGANEVTYTGDLNFFGVDTYDFTVVDGNGGSDVGTVMVTVNPVNDAPVANDQSFTLDEDTPTLLSIVAGDVDGDLLTWSVVDADTPHGTVFGTGPDVVYVPDADYHGADAFTVSVSDGNGGTDTAVISITVDPVNDQPVADATALTTNEDEDGTVTVTGSDVDGDALTFGTASSPSNGSVVCVGAVCTYTPNPDFNGADAFTFTVDDGNGGTDTASVSVTVTPVNDAPVATGAAVTTDEDTAVAVSLTASDVDGDALTFSYGAAGNGTVSGSGPNAVYTPNANFNGTDSFAFTVDDGNGGSDSNFAAIQVDAVNDAPIATGGTASTPEDTNVSFTLGASDVEGDALTFAVTSQPAVGSVSCDAAGSCTYNPPADFSGSVVVGYAVSDGALEGAGTFTILVDPVNDAPVPAAASAVTAEDTPVGLTLTATDTEGDALTYTVVAQPTNGSLTCSPSGSCTYTPSANSNGSDSFTWSVSDGGPAVTSTATITVVAVNDAPQALDVSASTDEDVPVSFFLLASDVEGDAITYSVDVPPSHGSVSIAGNVATYTPAADYSGTDLFTYKATDPTGAFTTARASLVVNDVPLVPTVVVAQPAVAKVAVNILGLAISGQVILLPELKATLTTAAGAPVVGRTLTMRIGGNVICSATTNAAGLAQCGGNLIGVAALLGGGYTATFDGDADRAASTAKGNIATVLSIKL